MRQNLGSKSGERAERAELHAIGAVDQVAVGDSGVRPNVQFWRSIGLVQEMPGTTQREAGDPVAAPDLRVCSQ
jgi:hypothetical protein